MANDYKNSIPAELWEEWRKVTKPFKEASNRLKKRERNERKCSK